MSAPFDSPALLQVSPVRREGGVACVAICHNERLILPQFLAHYRALGVGQFLIVDDRSTDGSFAYLREQNDVALFQPRDGSSYKKDVATWRHALLDSFCAERWVTLPDIDELLYFKGMDRSLADLADDLDRAGDKALIAAMIDMYADGPLGAQVFRGEGRLEDAFPYFDGQGTPPTGIRIVAQPGRFVRRYPTPPVAIMGGVRERMFYQRRRLSTVQRWLLSRFAHVGRPLSPGLLQRMQNRIVRAATKSCFSNVPFVLHKFALLRWQPGMRFARGPHSIDRAIQVSERLAVYLHFKFYKGAAGLEYSAARGQHAGGSALYSAMLPKLEAAPDTPVIPASRRFDGEASLCGILR